MKCLNTNHLTRLSILAITATLAACGGGGGGGDASNATPVPAPTPNTVEPSQQAIIPIVLNVTPGSYPVDSQELKIFNLINQERSRCGFGKLSQDATLDKSASRHTQYMIANNEFGHTETMGKTFFSGENSSDRAKNAGFIGSSVSEGIAVISHTKNEERKLTNGEMNIRGLLSAPFHAVNLLSPRQYIGIGHGGQPLPGSIYEAYATTLNYGAPSTNNGLSILQDLPSNDVLTYPCEGTTGVIGALYGETPSPYPDRNLNLNPIGASIYLAAKSGSNITVTSYELLNIITNKKEPLLTPRFGDKEIYPGTTSRFGSSELMNWVFISPDKILSEKTPYQAIIKGTVSGRDFTKSFTFTTQ